MLKPEIVYVKSEYTVDVPPGEYWLGDPCYAISDNDVWSSCCDQWFDKSHIRAPLAYVKDSFILAFSTHYGDGYYKDQYNHSFPVDSGCIGLVPVSIADTDPSSLSIKVEFKEKTRCRQVDGLLIFGKYRIDTKGQEDEDD